MKHTACARNFITLTLLALLAIQQMSDALTWVPQMSKYPEQTPRPPTLKLNHLGHAVDLAAEMKALLGQSPHIMGRYTLLPLIGLGPHSSKKKQDLDKLYELKSKVWQIMNHFGPSALINLSNFSSIKPEAASAPPQGSMANSTTVVKIPGTPGTGGRLSPENNQVLTKKKLQDFVREVDPNEQLDEDVEEMLLQNADDFIESVVTAACQLARH